VAVPPTWAAPPLDAAEGPRLLEDGPPADLDGSGAITLDG
jgi:hypothetical protein